MKTEINIPAEPKKGQVPAALYVQIEERLNARWAAPPKRDVVLEKRIDMNREKKW